MKAIVITRPGPPEVLQLHEVPEPPCRPGEVRVRVRAAGLNRADLLQRRGLYPAPPGVPADIPGLEFAGDVIESAGGGGGLQTGDRVMGILGGGGYAESVTVDAGLCVRVPDSLDWNQAGAVPEAFVTAYDALVLQGELAEGETLLLHAAASGVGTAAAQLALARGAEVIGLSRSAEKRRRLEELGLTRVLAPDREDLEEAIRDAASGGGVDVALNLVGAPTLPLEIRTMGTRGRVVVVGLLGGGRAELDLFELMRKRLRISGSVLRARSVEEKLALTRAWSRDVAPLLAAGRIRPLVDRTFPLDQAAAAHDYLERNSNFGKVVLTIGHED